MRRAIVFAWLLAGCSALSLDDGLTQESPCRVCGELNQIEAPPDCMSWQCSTSYDDPVGVCVLGLADFDEDGARLDGCPGEGMADCDDSDPLNRPRADGDPFRECLDGQTNDCDDEVDEGLFAPAPFELPALTEAGPVAWSDDGSFAVFRESSTAGSLRLLDAAGAIVAVTGQDAAGINPVTLAVGGDASGPLVIFQPFGMACEPLFLGRVDGADLRVPGPAMTPTPLPRLGGECGAGASETDVSHPRVAVDPGGRAVALWLEGSADRETCGAMAEPVVAIGARADGGDGPTLEGMATRVAEHGGLGGAALVAIGEGELVAAIVTASGEVELRRITANVPLSVAPAALHVESGCGAGCGRAALAVADGELAVAFRAGACDDAEVRVRHFRIEGAELTPIADAATVLEAGDVGPIALHRGIDGWAVAWAEGRRLFFAQLDPAGAASPVVRVAEQQALVREPIAMRGTEQSGGLAVLSHDANPGTFVAHRYVSCTARP